MFGQASSTTLRDMVMDFRPADRSPGTRRVCGQDAGSALLRNDAVHTVLPGPRVVSWCWSFSRKARGSHRCLREKWYVHILLLIPSQIGTNTTIFWDNPIYLIFRAAGFDSASGPIPGNVERLPGCVCRDARDRGGGGGARHAVRTVRSCWEEARPHTDTHGL